MAVKPKKKKTGRPRKTFDLKQVKECGSLGCTYDEMAGIFACSRRTIDERMANDEEFSQAYKEGLSDCKKSLRRHQLAAAKKGNAAMLIWLGKQMLGQRDTPIAIQAEEISFMVRERMKDGVAYFAEGEDLFDRPGATDTSEPE